METGLSAFLLVFWGAFVSFVEERFGKFQELPANVKQLVNAVLNFLVPAIVAWAVVPWWQKDFGNPEEFVEGALILLAPAFVWLVSQLAHYLDKGLKKLT